MSRRATRTIAPSVEPLTTAEAKEHLLIASAVTGHDGWLEDTITAVREYYEHATDTAVIASTWTQTYRDWPAEIELLRRPVSAITSITYRDTSGNSQTLASSNYRLDAGETQPRIVWDDTAVLPTLDDRPEAITVTYVAGYANAAAVPLDIKHALKLALSQQFEQRSGQSPTNMRASEMGFMAFVNSHSRSTYP